MTNTVLSPCFLHIHVDSALSLPSSKKLGGGEGITYSRGHAYFKFWPQDWHIFKGTVIRGFTLPVCHTS